MAKACYSSELADMAVREPYVAAVFEHEIATKLGAQPAMAAETQVELRPLQLLQRV